jgi:hypothetical protein
LLSADPKPTLPFMAEEADIRGRSIEDALSIDEVDGCWRKLGRPCCDGLALAAPTMTRDGRRWINGALAVFCFTVCQS